MDNTCKIFISYRRLNRDLVLAVTNEIRVNTGIECWVDTSGIESGDYFENKIIQAIKQCDILIFMLTKESIQVPLYGESWTQKEVKFALSHGKRVIPISLDGTSTKDCDWLNFNCSGLDYIDLSVGYLKEKLFKDLCNWCGVEYQRKVSKSSISISIEPKSEKESAIQPDENSGNFMERFTAKIGKIFNNLGIGDYAITDITDNEKPTLPPLNLLSDYKTLTHEITEPEVSEKISKIKDILQDCNINASEITHQAGASYSLFEVTTDRILKIKEIAAVQELVSRHFGVSRVIPLADTFAIEIPNSHPSIVPLKSLFNNNFIRNDKMFKIPLNIGQSICYGNRTLDLSKAPNIFIGGGSKEEQTNILNVFILSLIYSKNPDKLKFVILETDDYKFKPYSNLYKNHFALPSEMRGDIDGNTFHSAKVPINTRLMLDGLSAEYRSRIRLIENSGSSNIEDYNRLVRDKDGKELPYIVTIIPDLIKFLQLHDYSSLENIAGKGSIAGIHLIIASENMPHGIYNNNWISDFPKRIMFKVQDESASVAVLDSPDALLLNGEGDMLFTDGIETDRIQAAIVSQHEIVKIIKHIKEQDNDTAPYYLESPYHFDINPKDYNL